MHFLFRRKTRYVSKWWLQLVVQQSRWFLASVWVKRNKILYDNGSACMAWQNNPPPECVVNGTECYVGWVRVCGQCTEYYIPLQVASPPKFPSAHSLVLPPLKYVGSERDTLDSRQNGPLLQICWYKLVCSSATSSIILFPSKGCQQVCLLVYHWTQSMLWDQNLSSHT